ncbi:P-loop NTPase fold protein [Halodesulfovibrio sp. MK-HDV]|uniref:KAP family P-loop NTPase fold protein n=1 Tax=Halodesulfovibrio sp. MK-HDV TaxID=2599925 RepID=UPI0013689E32|nr:P-loop NTPase fold protein [Halodesulfovibrio sp. MK-HDV]KAF1074535.1 hypothetical protein MKHDV_02610 [Halodesulfovibrio sp. MK-HDV]
MFRRPPKFVATPEAPFENDKLGREKSIRNLTTLMEGTDTPMVMTVSAPWGSGKSSFVKMWKAHLESEKGGRHPCIMFDAWKHDFHKEPLLAVMGEIGSYLASQKKDSSNCSKAVDACLNHLPFLLRIGEKALKLYSTVDPTAAIGGAALAKGGDFAEAVKKYVSQEHSDVKTRMIKFKNALKAFVKEATKAPNSDPLYFFVDELDRCDPEYAIRLLESVKHFFDVEGIVFVLSVDRKKLGSMVKVRYGEGFNAEGYLKRFVDVDYQIKAPEHEEFILLLSEQLVPSLGDETRASRVAALATELAMSFTMAPRDVEKAFLKVPVLLATPNDVTSDDVLPLNERSLSWINQRVRRDTTHYVSRTMVKDFFHPILILLFIKEASERHYSNFEEAYDYRNEQNRKEWRQGRPESRYVNLIRESKGYAAHSDRNLDNKLVMSPDSYSEVKNLMYMLSAKTDYWTAQYDKLRGQLDSLDNIVFLSTE